MSLNEIIAVSRPIVSNLWASEPITMALRSKGLIYGPSNAAVAGSNPNEDMDSVSSVVCCVVSGLFDLFRVLPGVCMGCVCVCVCGVWGVCVCVCGVWCVCVCGVCGVCVVCVVFVCVCGVYVCV